MYLKVDGISFSYGKVPVLKDISLQVAKGSVLGLLGPNGVGKTTLLKCLGGMLPVKTGDVLLEGKSIVSAPVSRRGSIVGYVPQSAQTGSGARVVDIVMNGRVPYFRFSPSSEDRRIAFEAIERLQLGDLAFRAFDELSGGERQRVLMARAMAQQPKILFFDEPTSSLDMKYQLEAIRIIRGYVAEKNVAAVVSIHDLNLAAMLCDQVVLFQNGGRVLQGTCEQIFTTENIKAAYGVEVEIVEWRGRRQVLPAEI